jgi:hypothetical protein
MTSVQGIIDALKLEYAGERSFIDGLPAESRQRHGTPEAWSALDLQGHITSWKHQTVLRLRDDPSAIMEESEDDTDQANAVFFDSFAGRSWDDILSQSDSTHAELIEGLQRLSDDELAQMDRFAWQEGQPLWRRLAGTLLIHPWMHMAEHALERGDEQAASAQADAMLEHFRQLSELASWRGILYYNASCLSARAGRSDRALDYLRTGLEHHPDLIGWSREDRDLESLRSDPRLEQLYARLEG